MPPRKPEIRSGEDAVAQLADRIRRLEDTVARRVFPPGYEVVVTDDDIIVIRVSDGATATIGSF